MSKATGFWAIPGKEDVLRELWANGHSTRDIGLRLGTTKHSVVGRAHRLGLPARPSPIKLSPADAAGKARDRAQEKIRRAILANEKRERVTARVRRSVEGVAEAGLPEIVLRPGKVEPCCWPFGTPRTPSFRYCDEPSLPGKAYCDDHQRRAWLRSTRPIQSDQQSHGPEG
jgi:GcrA cell cycle regulator